MIFSLNFHRTRKFEELEPGLPFIFNNFQINFLKITQIKLEKEDAFLKDFASIVKIKKSDKKQLDGFFTQILKYSDNETRNIIALLNKLYVYSLKDLQSLSDDGWKLLFNQMPSRTDEIREETEKLESINSTSGFSIVKDECEQLSDWHKVERFLYFEAKMTTELNMTGYLSLEALTKSFEKEEKDKTYNMDTSLSNDLKRRFESFTLQDKYSLKKNRGKNYLVGF